MCDKPNIFTALLTPPPAAEPPSPTPGSRRHRLWELPSQALCPVIGVCLPMSVLRRRIGKALGGQAIANDYELHCGAINECNRRTPIAQTLQRELEQRYALALRQTSSLKSSEALKRWWDAAVQQGCEVAGALWATLTHPRCDEPLRDQVLRDIHMLQHQVGAGQRADLQRLEALTEENAVLGRELARAQSRATQMLTERSTQIEQQQSEMLRLRAELLARDTRLAGLQEELEAVHAAEPGLRKRQALSAQLEHQQQRLQQLERALNEARTVAERERRRADEAMGALAALQASLAQEQVAAEAETVLPELTSRAVLCVGGRPSVVPIYRQLIERTGGRFLHHDGGEEDAQTRLDASLAAADLVICQTGCVSHDAYWRVKDHCKRHGKRCVFVDKPSASSLQRALGTLAEESKTGD